MDRELPAQFPASRSNSRKRLLETAAILFYTRGINSTGIDVVLAEARVAKGSMYHHFAGKQALVVAYLQDQKLGWQTRVETADRPDLPPADRVARMFAALADAVESGTFYGCPFTNAAIERPDDLEIRDLIDSYRWLVADHISFLLGDRTSPELVSMVMVLYDGATTAAKLTRSSKEVRIASALACEVVNCRAASRRDPRQ